MKSCSYWTAGHITAFFKIADSSDDVLYKGSLGTGFNIARGVLTRVELSDKSEFRVFFDNIEQSNQSIGITNFILAQLKELSNESLPGLHIYYSFEVPIGSGYGSSAAAALSTAFAVNKLLDLQIQPVQLWQLAHKAEISNKTGLGDILGLYSNSEFEQRVKEGAPEIGKVISLDLDSKDYDLYTYSIGSLSKKNILSNTKIREMITLKGNQALENFNADPTFENFCKQSIEFTKSINLLPENLIKILTSLPKVIKGSQIMLGESLFLFVPKGQKLPVIENFLPVQETLVKNTLQRIK